MKKRNRTVEMHGIVREIDFKYVGMVFETTYMDNEQTGLCRLIDKDMVIVRLRKDGKMIAKLCFDHDFNELTEGNDARNDPHGYFNAIQPLIFKKDD